MNAFDEEKRKKVEIQMIEEGFRMLKEGGLKKVNIETIANECGVSKGSFYSFFDTKATFIYAIMIYKRNQAKQKLQDYLSNGLLDFEALYQYLLWLAYSDLDIFAHMSEEEQIYLKEQWPDEYFNNDCNNHNTVSLVLNHLSHPKEDANMLLFANYLKLIALSKAEKRVFALPSFDEMIANLVKLACECISLKN